MHKKMLIRGEEGEAKTMMQEFLKAISERSFQSVVMQLEISERSDYLQAIWWFKDAEEISLTHMIPEPYEGDWPCGEECCNFRPLSVGEGLPGLTREISQALQVVRDCPALHKEDKYKILDELD